MGKANILIICDSYPPPWDGGGSVNAEYYSESLKDLGYKVKVLCCKTSDNLQNENNVHRLLSHKSYWFDDINKLYESIINDKIVIQRILLQFKPDLIFFLHLWNIAGETLRFLSNLSVKKIYRFGDECFRLHCISPPNNLNHGYISRPIKDFDADLIITNSNELQKRLTLFTNAPKTVIPNPVIIQNSVSAPNKFHACFIGRIVEHKGLEILLEIVNVLSPLFSLDIVGPCTKPAFYNLLKKQYLELENKKLINWVGPIDHYMVPKYISNARYVIFPSTQRNHNRTIEGCPNVMLEAWASKRLFITSIYAGHNEYLKHGINCYSVNSESIQEWSDALLWCHENKLFYDQVTDSAFEYVKMNHSFELFKRTIANVILSVLN